MRAFDGHNDVLSRLHHAGGGNEEFLAGGDGHLDVPGAREGGLAGGLFAVFPCSPFRGEDNPFAVDYARPPDRREALADTLAMVDRLGAIERESDGSVRMVRDAAALDACLEAGTLAAVLHFEGAEAIGPELERLGAFHEAGLRSLGLTWSRPNAFGHGTPFDFPGSPDQGPGLSDAGRALVRACNELGIVVDLAHLNERGFWDVAELSDAPLVASHSNAHALCPSPRNLTDDQLRAVGESGGVVGINFCVAFVREDGADDPDTPLSAIAAHAAHVAELAGPDAVALGSDFDGATMPNELDDAAKLPGLFDALRAFGFDEPELERIALGNWRRVLRATWDTS
ncbi:MAG TPA: dipeptidase [Thermoleophilaceae bacterium]|nr:dipeptidase [Thermoleophilaceae bacterium]